MKTFLKRMLIFVIGVSGAITGLYTLRYAMRLNDPTALSIGFLVTLLSGMFIQELKQEPKEKTNASS